jgi:hypothetical protein
MARRGRGAPEGGIVFTFRRMTPADKPVLVAIAARIWDGTDYLPAVFDEWVADTEGEFAAVLLDGRIVGCGKLTFLTRTDAWLEGLRKDPDLTEKGITAAVTTHFLEGLAARKDLASIRFATYVRNLASITANERMGFRRYLTLSCKAWSGKREELAAVSIGTTQRGRLVVRQVADEQQAFDFLEASGYLDATRGLLLEGWRALPYARGLFSSRYIRAGFCWGAFDGAELRGMAVFFHDPRRAHTYIRLVMIDAREPAAADLLLDRLFAFARERASDYNEIELIAPPIARVREPCAARGFRSWEQEDDFLVYEYPEVGS